MTTMEFGNFKSYSTSGDQAITSMIQIETEYQKHRSKFMNFVTRNGFTAWHIHNGHVTHNGDNGNVLHNDRLTLTWASGHGGYSHSLRSPFIENKMVIVKDSPSGIHKQHFKIYAYEIFDARRSFGYIRYDLKLIGISEAIYKNEEYMFCKSTNIFSRLIEWIKPYSHA